MAEHRPNVRAAVSMTWLDDAVRLARSGEHDEIHLDRDELLALAEVVKAAKKYHAAWNTDYGSYEEGQVIVTTRLDLEAAFARLDGLG